MMSRRALVVLALLPPAAAAEEAFPPVVEAAGARLIRNGAGSRRYWGVVVYQAALYLPQPVRQAPALLGAAAPWVILLRYARAVPAEVARTAWAESYAANGAGGAPAALLDWVRPAEPGDMERYAAGPEGARLHGPGRADAELPGPAAGRALLATWLGPAPPTESLKRGLLGAA